MVPPFILPLSQSNDLNLVGGKALGLHRLIEAGFPVPQGLCITTEAYTQHLRHAGFRDQDEWHRISGLLEADQIPALADCRTRINQADIAQLTTDCLTAVHALGQPPEFRWAVRSSGTAEDAAHASSAGLYRTHLGLALTEIEQAIKDLWASLWEVRVLSYLTRQRQKVTPRMAVVIQPMIDAQTAGVAYSIHPVTKRRSRVMINAVPGLAAGLVDGTMTPDQYVVEVPPDGKPFQIRTRLVARKAECLFTSNTGLCRVSLDEDVQRQSSLTDTQILSLAHTAKEIERTFGHPTDIEWAFDTQQLWIVQARPITAIPQSANLTNDDCEWSRTNFKETLPELPSPLSLLFLEQFMDRYILRHYRRFGCQIPDELTPVRVLHGRPYLNVTLFHLLVAQLGGDPSLNAEQMGGEPLQSPPQVERLGGIAALRAAGFMLMEMRRVEKIGPRVFTEMKALAVTYRREPVQNLSFEELISELGKLDPWLARREVTFGIAGGVGQCLQFFSRLLPGWLGPDWRVLLNAALQGQGTVISAQQILRLAELTDIAKAEPLTRTVLTSSSWNPTTFRATLAGTEFLQTFDKYLEDYGHRGVGESDVMSPRLAENPESILSILRTQLISNAPSLDTVQLRQGKRQTSALTEIRQRMGWRVDRWAIFLWWYRRLCRFFSLREANRHHLMYYSMAVRTLLIRLGELLVKRGCLPEVDDIFFLTIADRVDFLTNHTQDWSAVIKARRNERARNATFEVPDTIHDWTAANQQTLIQDHSDGNDVLSGMPISIGTVVGPVRLIKSAADWSKVKPGEILVVPVIDPGLAPLFGLAGGLIAEMGGTLSHGAIIAREYGLPTIANVGAAMTRLSDGLSVTLDAGSGTIRIGPSQPLTTI
ncbi:MAG TPA: PEP/pyruvate-binding domain-containing protein [Nitrospira sp.]|nr:PEP/pyruvate-binding domain-containing protein [Nitrospira sp.]